MKCNVCQVRAELDRLVRGSSALSEHVGGLDVRLAQATASTASQESRLTTVEQIAAGLVTHEPTGSELCRLCLVFEDRYTVEHIYTGCNSSYPILTSPIISIVCRSTLS